MGLVHLAARSASREDDRAAPSWLVVVIAAATVVAAIGATVQVVRIGHSGAEATWSGTRTSGG